MTFLYNYTNREIVSARITYIAVCIVTISVAAAYRSCVDTHFLVNGVRYCRENCLPHTHCGPVTVPTDHQARCRSCTKPGLQCVESGVGGGGGVEGGHFLLYISALDQPHCEQGEPKSLYVHAVTCNPEKINICLNIICATKHVLWIRKTFLFTVGKLVLVESKDPTSPKQKNQAQLKQRINKLKNSVGRQNGYAVSTTTMRWVPPLCGWAGGTSQGYQICLAE